MTAVSEAELDRQSGVWPDSGKRAFQAHPVSAGSNHTGFLLWRLDLKCCSLNRIRKVECTREDARFAPPAETTS